MELRSRMVSANGRRYRICQRLPLSIIFAQHFFQPCLSPNHKLLVILVLPTIPTYPLLPRNLRVRPSSMLLRVHVPSWEDCLVSP